MIQEKGKNIQSIHIPRFTSINELSIILLLVAITLLAPVHVVPTALSLEMPPLSPTNHHTSNFGARKNHPATYEESTAFKGFIYYLLRTNIVTVFSRI